MNTQGVSYPSIERRESLTILQKIGKSNQAAVEDCLNTYGSLIWALAKSHTESIEEAEKMTLKIFNDIWTCAAQFDSAKCTEKTYVLKIAARRLIKRSYPTTED